MRRKKVKNRFKRFMADISAHTPFVEMIVLLTGLWLLFAAGLLLAEQRAGEPAIDSYGEALYWGIAAFSTAGIADMPRSGAAQLIGGTWIIVGSVLFFGTIVATITGYFMRPMQRPAKRIIDTIEYNLEQLDDLALDELDLLKSTVDGLIEHMEHLKERQTPERREGNTP